MGRHEDVTAGLREFRDRPEDLDPGQRVGARERLVEDQDLRSVGERLGEFRSLAHPAAIGPGGTLRRARETDELQGVFRGLFGLRTRHPVESQEGFHELLPGEPAVERVVLGAVAEAPLHRDVVPRILAQEPQGPLVRMQLADEELEQRALAGAIRTDEARDAGAERGRKAVEAEDLAVPLRDARRLDDTGHPDTTSTNFIRR